jgi:hypothetical protein
MARDEPIIERIIDWSKVITDRPPPVRSQDHDDVQAFEVYDLFGPMDPMPEHPRHRADAGRLAS